MVMGLQNLPNPFFGYLAWGLVWILPIFADMTIFSLTPVLPIRPCL